MHMIGSDVWNNVDCYYQMRTRFSVQSAVLLSVMRLRLSTQDDLISLVCRICVSSTRATLKVSGIDILDNNIFHNLYISETYILY